MHQKQPTMDQVAVEHFKLFGSKAVTRLDSQYMYM